MTIRLLAPAATFTRCAKKLPQPRARAIQGLFTLATIAAAALAGCGGGSTAPTQVVAAAPAPAPSVTLSGTAATGLAAANAGITVKCAGSATVFTTTAGLDGRFSVSVNQVPCMVRATFGTPSQSLYSIATQSGLIDISPLTDLVVAAFGQTSPDIVFDSFDPANPPTINSAALANAIALVKRRAANAGVNIDAIDILRQSFDARTGDAYDDALEVLKAAPPSQATLRGDVAAGRDGAPAPAPTPASVPTPTPAPVPAPQMPVISLTEAGDGQVRVSWTPAQAGTSYAVFYAPTGTSISGSIPFPTNSAVGTSPVTVTGLTNGVGYTFAVRATNASSVTADSNYAFVTPHPSGQLFTQYCTSGPSCVDSYRSNANYGGYYKSIAYTRYGGQDHYVAVKSNRQIMRLVDDGPPTHVIDPFGGVNLTALNAIAGGDNGNFFAVGDTGLLARSQDGGLTWTSTNLGFTGATADSINYKSVTYGGGKFVAVGSYVDSFSKTRDIFVTFDLNYTPPGGTSCSSFCGIAAVTPGNSIGLTQVAFGNGLFVAVGSNNYYFDAVTYTLQYGSTAGYTSMDGVTWTLNVPTPVNAFADGADRLFYFNGLFWGLRVTGATGGYRSSTGTNWGSSNWQVTNPGNFIQDMVVGVNQIVAVDAGGYTYVNKIGGSTIGSWTSSSPSTYLYRTSGTERNLVTYGNGRYVAISLGSVWFSK